MSLKSISLDSIPDQTARIARTAFPRCNTYLKLRDQFGSIYEDADFDQLFPVRGRPAESPARLALIVIFQFLENLSRPCRQLSRQSQNRLEIRARS